VEKFYELVIRHRKIIFAVFIGIAVICAMAQKFVSVNYDMNSYLPEALSYKEKLGEIDGVTVNELCDEAMIRRAAFHKHFADKYDFFFFFYPPKAGPVHLTGKRGNSPQRNLCLHALP
jgi:hypothetical protein